MLVMGFVKLWAHLQISGFDDTVEEVLVILGQLQDPPLIPSMVHCVMVPYLFDLKQNQYSISHNVF